MSYESAPSAPNQSDNLGLDPDTSFELISEVLHTGQQLDAELAAFGFEATEKLYDNENEAAPLQEKYDLTFDPEVAVRGVGGTALTLAMASPEVAGHIMTEQTAGVVSEPQQRQEKEVEQPRTKNDKQERKEDDIKTSPSKPGAHNSHLVVTADKIDEAAKELVYITTGIPINKE